MIEADLLPPLITAGTRVSSMEGTIGTLGLLCWNGDGTPFAVTSALAVSPGAISEVESRGDVLPLEPALALGATDRAGIKPIASLLAFIAIPDDISVSATLLGWDQAEQCWSLDAAEQEKLYIVRSNGSSDFGMLVARNATETFWIDGEARQFYGAAEVEMLEGIDLEPGDAGSVVVTSTGAPVGILLGAKQRTAIIAPLYEVLDDAGLLPLSTYDASAHRERVRDRRWQREMELRRQRELEAPVEDLERAMNSPGSSDEIMQRNMHLFEEEGA
jgi:hypothetical protein